ncbi:hypothetical protein [Kitasatospora sp. KL5]|uniref:hypothetical protein n=1 Tax=Kitasatospora sp. KL5 TaxID=3425125 RepID=UPI003D6E08F3
MSAGSWNVGAPGAALLAGAALVPTALLAAPWIWSPGVAVLPLLPHPASTTAAATAAAVRAA